MTQSHEPNQGTGSGEVVGKGEQSTVLGGFFSSNKEENELKGGGM